MRRISDIIGVISAIAFLGCIIAVIVLNILTIKTRRETSDIWEEYGKTMEALADHYEAQNKKMLGEQ